MTTSPPLPPQSAAIVAEYVEFMQACTLSAKTVKARRQFAAARLRDWGAHGITRANAIAYLADLSRKFNDDTISDWTVTTYHGHMKALAEWASLAGYAEPGVMGGIKKPRRPEQVPNALSEGEVRRLLSVAIGDIRDWLLLGLYMGLRAHEIGKIKCSDVHGEHLYVKGKGGKRVEMKMHPVVQRMAERHAEVGGMFWFPGTDNGHISGHRVSADIGHLFKSLGIKGSSHRCRHYYGTWLVRQGVHVAKIQKLMRHASLATTQGYLRILETDLDDAILSLPDLDLNPPLPAA